LAPHDRTAHTAALTGPSGDRPGKTVPGKPPRSASPGDKTLTKGLQLLEALSAGESSRGLSELAHELSLTKSNVHRLLQTLTRCGYVTREASTERYLLSSRLWQVARRGRSFETLRSLARPILRDLVEETNESAVFVVAEHDDLVVIDQVETANPVRVVFFGIGQSFPIGQVAMTGRGLTALQLIALAARPEAEARSTLRKVQMQLKKGKAFVDEQLAELSAIRKNGWTVNRGKWVCGVNAAAVPVYDSRHRLLGIMSCFGPADRLTERKIAGILKALASKAGELSQRLGA